MRSIVASHFILSLRQVFLAEQNDANNLPSLHISSVRFAGNLGAPLQMADDNAIHDKGSKMRLDPASAMPANGTVRGLVSSNPLAAGIFEDDDSLLDGSAMYVCGLVASLSEGRR